uniref:tRNA (cytidine(34)-2'-O)-methyltransferase n=1 Tax=Ndongobacter massiliensis TaxID=1871025 RepID=UPI000930FBF1|nr:tRNA (cytidine(34)-2'-O)-methyltransferase [Ndongobacter massiliensis]
MEGKNKNIVVLVEPEIPYNTGNIARTCVSTHTALHLVRPYGFHLTNRYIKRAGMDYWPHVDLTEWDSLEEFCPFMEARVQEGYDVVYATTKGRKTLGDLQISGPAILLFGKESAGLPAWLREAHPERCIRIPMYAQERSLNLSNSQAIVLYEVLRQQGYPDLH